MRQDQYLRYSRHLILPEIGLKGQNHLLNARILVIGAGGLGCPALQYFAAAGVGYLGIADFDKVESSNLQRQVLYTTSDLGRLKADVAAERIRTMNPDVRVKAYPFRVTSKNMLEILEDYDLVLDGSDNFPTRYLLNDAAVLTEKPYIYGSVYRFEGQVAVFHKEKGPCYRCLFPEPPEEGLVPSCAEGGVLGVLPGMIGVLQATEAIKILTEFAPVQYGGLLLYNALESTLRRVMVRRNPDCPLCGDHPTMDRLIDYDRFCGTEAEPRKMESGIDVDPLDVQSRLAQGEDIVLIDVREAFERQIASIQDSVWCPLSDILLRLPEFETYHQKDIFVFCHKGGRSTMAVQILRSRGFERTWNIRGGIDAWSAIVDPSIPRY